MADHAKTARISQEERLVRSDAVGYLVFGTAGAGALAAIANRIEFLGFFCYVPGVASDNACIPAYFPIWLIPIGYVIGGFLMFYRFMERNARLGAASAGDYAVHVHEKEVVLRGKAFGIAGLILAAVSVFAARDFNVAIIWLALSSCAVAVYCGERLWSGAAAALAALGLFLVSPESLGETVAAVNIGNGMFSLPIFVVAFLPFALPLGAVAVSRIRTKSRSAVAT